MSFLDPIDEEETSDENGFFYFSDQFGSDVRKSQQGAANSIDDDSEFSHLLDS